MTSLEKSEVKLKRSMSSSLTSYGWKRIRKKERTLQLLSFGMGKSRSLPFLPPVNLKKVAYTFSFGFDYSTLKQFHNKTSQPIL